MPTTEPDNTGIVRDKRGRIVKGSQSLNPGGRPRSPSKYIMSKTKDTEEIIDTLLEMSMDKTISVANRIKIHEILMAYAIGKPSQHQVIEQITNIVVDKPEDTELDE